MALDIAKKLGMRIIYYGSYVIVVWWCDLLLLYLKLFI